MTATAKAPSQKTHTLAGLDQTRIYQLKDGRYIFWSDVHGEWRVLVSN